MLSLAWKNISRRLGSSAITIAVIFVAVFSVVSSSVVLNALNQGADLSRQRLGADVMVLPAGVSSDVESVLFAAQPINVYFSPDVIDQIKSIDGVAKATPQFFTQTVDQSCCSVIGVTRVVGIDPESDFVISPWMKSGSIDAIGTNGIVLGASAPQVEGGQASILGTTFQITGTLDATGTSIDDTIFMSIDSARNIATQSPYLKSIWEHADANDSISCIMVKVSDETDASSVANSIVEQCPGVTAVTTSKLISGASNQLAVLSTIALFMMILIAAVSAVALIGRFGALVENRATEIGLMRLLGLSSARSMGSVALEAFIMLLIGTVLACVAACAFSGFTTNYIHDALQLPHAITSASVYATAILTGTAFGIVLGALSFVGPLIKQTRSNTHSILTKGGLR